MRGGKKACPLAGRIKKLMQADEDVGKIAQASPVLIGEGLGGHLRRFSISGAPVRAASVPGSSADPSDAPVWCAARAMELFLEKLCKGTSEVAAARQAKTVTSSHL